MSTLLLNDVFLKLYKVTFDLFLHSEKIQIGAQIQKARDKKKKQTKTGSIQSLFFTPIYTKEKSISVRKNQQLHFS